jgi:hypothetical protein
MATGFDTGFDPIVESAIGMATRRGNDQQDTIDRLNKLSDVDWVVNAEALVAPNGTQVATYVRCGNDTAHGHGTVSVPGYELLCPDCAANVVTGELVENGRVDVAVLL